MFMRGGRDGWVFRMKSLDGKILEEHWIDFGVVLCWVLCLVVLILYVCMYAFSLGRRKDGKMDILGILIRWEGHIDTKIRSFRIRNGSYVLSRLILISAVAIFH